MSKIIVALDGMDQNRAVEMIHQLKDYVYAFKLEDMLYNQRWVLEFARTQAWLMADAKIYKAPHSAVNTFRRLQDLGALFVTAHAAGGKQMLVEMQKWAKKTSIATIQALTTQSEDEIAMIYGKDRASLVMLLTAMAIDVGVTHFVTSALEMPIVLATAEKKGVVVKTIMPGYRPKGLIKADDQIFTADDEQAKKATFVVVGRPITESTDPVLAAQEINKSLE